MAVDLRSAVNFPQLLATAIERENVPICVRKAITVGTLASAANDPSARFVQFYGLPIRRL